MKRWLEYGAVWIVCLIVYIASRQWMAWMILLSVSLLPLLSLVVSLPMMLLSRLQVSVPDVVAAGAEVPLEIRLESPLPAPVWSLRVEAHHVFSGQTWLLQAGTELPTEHCGAWYIQMRRGRVYDYMGLFFLPLKTPADLRLLVRPRPVQPKELPDLQKQIVTYWRPKAGGGFSENHELRLYRPGDSLRQIHWKLSGKTGKLIYREPMERMNNALLLHLVHGGQGSQLDRKLGKLLWLGMDLTRRRLQFDVLADTVQGQKRWSVRTQAELLAVVDDLLCLPPLEQADLATTGGAGYGLYYIGGDDDETK